MYRVKSHEKNIFTPSKQNDPNKPEIVKIKLPLMKRMQVYLTKDFVFAPLCCCFKSKVMEEYHDILDTGASRMEEEMDIYNIIKKQRALQFELDQIKAKMGIESNAYEGLDNSKSLINIDATEDGGLVKLKGVSIDYSAG